MIAESGKSRQAAWFAENPESCRVINRKGSQEIAGNPIAHRG